MSIYAELVLALLVVVIAVWAAKEAAPPFNYVLWAIVAVAVAIMVLRVTHGASGLGAH